MHGPPKTAGGVVVALALLGALAFNVAGIVRLPVGPLGSSDEPGEGRQMTVVPQDEPDEVYTTVILENAWPVPATLESVVPILRSTAGGAEVVGAQSYDSTRLSGGQRLVLGSVRERPTEWAGDHPVAGAEVPAAAEGHGAVALVRVWGNPDASTDVAGYEIHYRVGPFTFRTISTVNSLVLCSNDGEVPPACDDAEQAASAVGRILVGGDWRLISDRPTRDPSVLRAAADAASYKGHLARAFVFTIARGDGTTEEILVAPDPNGTWRIVTSFE